ncbi:MAG: sigma-70 family RNA polymerase sigma factor [Verrucomicrobia bacterium]|nr:MAG: sigma-70 family RNA polymerase sigma factor [Verrucomicrobiota bacterium]
MNTDFDLLREYAERQSEEAFATLVSRYLNLVYSAALRKTGDPHAAQEITQAVFIILARKAKSLGPKIILSGWLYHTTRLTAANYLRTEIRRARREQEAYMQSLANETESNPWPQIAPLLEDAMGRLGERDRHALVLRFLDGKNLEEVGAALGVSADAAKMRVNRAVEKLRVVFSKRGITVSAGAIIGAVSINSVQAAPTGLAALTVGAATKGAVATASTAALANSTLQTMTWWKLKTAAAVAAALLAVGGATSLIVSQSKIGRVNWWSNSSANSALLIVPQKSVGPVRADMTIPQVIAALGQPDKRTGNFLHYVRSGFSVISNPDNDSLRAIFCGDSLGRNGPMTRAFKGRTREGIGMGSTRAEVIAAYGTPSDTRAAAINESLQYETLGLTFTLSEGKVVYLVVNF